MFISDASEHIIGGLIRMDTTEPLHLAWRIRDHLAIAPIAKRQGSGPDAIERSIKHDGED